MASLPLVFLPGILCDRALWAAQMDGLSDVAEGVFVALDAPTIEAMANQALRQAPPRFNLCALSMGGYVALAIMAKAPERVARLCLANTSGRADTEAQTAGRLRLMELAIADGLGAVVERLTPVAIHSDRHHDAALMAAASGMMQRQDTATFLRQQAAVMARPDRLPDLASIAVPTWIIGGDGDRVIPPDHSVELAQRIPGARLEIVERCGHLSPMERPEAVTALLRDWLDKTEGG